MNSNEITSLAPTGPYVEGLIRFSYDSASQGATQKPHFEVLSRVHAEDPQPGDVPKMVSHVLGDKIEGVDGEGEGRRLYVTASQSDQHRYPFTGFRTLQISCITLLLPTISVMKGCSMNTMNVMVKT